MHQWQQWSWNPWWHGYLFIFLCRKRTVLSLLTMLLLHACVYEILPNYKVRSLYWKVSSFQFATRNSCDECIIPYSFSLFIRSCLVTQQPVSCLLADSSVKEELPLIDALLLSGVRFNKFLSSTLVRKDLAWVLVMTNQTHLLVAWLVYMVDVFDLD